MTTQEMTVEQAIERSQTHNEVVFLDFTVDAETTLLCLSDDNAETETELEFWGSDGGEWRVHLRKPNDVMTIAEIWTAIEEAGVSAETVWAELGGGDRVPSLRSAVESAIESAGA